MKACLCLLILILSLSVSSPPLNATDNPAAVSPAWKTRLIWIGRGAMIVQMDHSQHKMQGTTRPPNTPMGDMGMTGKKEPQHHDHHKHHKQLNATDMMRPRSTLKPAEGAKVKILSPKAGEEVKGDEVNLHFELVKGKRGHHIHAYVDGMLMGMFTANDGSREGIGTLTGVSPGHHNLEIRAVTEGHNIEVDATDTVDFIVK